MFNATMQFDLGEDVNALREMVHRWAQERVKPMAAAIDQSNDFPPELWKEMGDLGLLGITVPEEYGGAGMSYLAHTIAVEELARASASVSRSNSGVTLNGEHGARSIRHKECVFASWYASRTRTQSASTSASRSTQSSGGSPPPLCPRLMLPRQRCRRMPNSSAASSTASMRTSLWGGTM